MKSRLAFPLFIAPMVLICATVHAQSQPTVTVEILTTFTYPGSTFVTAAKAISNTGKVAGDFNNRGHQSGFVRLPQGKFGPAFNASTADTLVGAINSSGVVAGYTLDPLTAAHGYFYDRGVVTPYDVPGSNSTLLYGLNDSGNLCGRYTVPNGPGTGTGFASIGGTITDIAIGAADFVSPQAINNNDELVGWYSVSGESGQHGFFRRADGSAIFPLDFPGGAIYSGLWRQ